MKLTRKKLKEMILKEISGTAGTATDVKARKSAESATKKQKTTKKTKKTAWNTAKSDYKVANADLDTKTSTYNSRQSDLDSVASQKYRKANRAARGGYDYSSNPIKGGETNPDWTTKSNLRNTALSEYDTAVDNLTSAERAEKAQKKATSFAVSAGGGGRKGGKAGTGKKAKKESLFRILGRDFLNELNDIKKYR